MTTLNLVLTLSEKEQTIYDLLCQNFSNSEIGEKIDMSESTVKYRLKAIYRKLGVSSCDKSDLHLCRQRAISYGGTKITQVVGNKSENFSEQQIREASKLLHWYDKSRVDEIMSDLFAVLKKSL